MSTDLARTSPPRTGRGGALRLAHWGVIRADGADAAGFLHSQLSNDISHLGAEQARLAAWCTAQGRMLASFVVARATAPDEFWLACRADLLPAMLKRLSMFVLRAKAKLNDAGSALAVLGLLGPSAAAWLAGQAVDLAAPWRAAACAGGRLLRLPDAPGQPRWLWIGPAEAADALLAALPADGINSATWDALEIAAGVVPVQAATSGLFVPQMLNFELVGGIDFKKGCYPGQEVVARSHYLGKLKRRGVMLAMAGAEIWWNGDAAQPAGQVAQAAPASADAVHHGGDGGDGAGWLLLAEMKLAALGDVPDGGPSTLHLGSRQGPTLRRLPLPYTLPQEEQAAA
jgi:folate-binding protein YgfZ